MQKSAIAKSRDNAWDVVTNRVHEVIKVYASDAQGLDLLMTGNLVATVQSGEVTEVSFAARAVIEEIAGGFRMSLYQAWSVGSLSSWLFRKLLHINTVLIINRIKPLLETW